MKNNKILLHGLTLAVAMSAPASVLASVNIDLYGSARLQAEAVSPDSGASYASGGNNSYISTRDAFSRLGMNANWQASENVGLFGQLEIPFDLANWATRDTFDDRRDIRVAQIGADIENWGRLAYGQMWLPYYNAIAYRVDRFSSSYSGYATYAYFRFDNTLSYYSPDINGFSFAAAYIGKNTQNTSTSNREHSREYDGYQATASYAFGQTDLSIGYDQYDNDNTELWGLSMGHQLSNIYIGAKLEQFQSKSDSGYGSDGSMAYNLFIDYTLNNYTFKAMAAKVENYGETIVHLGVDYQVNRDLKVFAEYYQQEDGAAIANEKATGAGNYADLLNGGGKVIMAGVRFDF